MKHENEQPIARYVPLVSGVGLLGLLVSLYLLSDYATPVLHLVHDFIRHLH